MAHHGSRSTTLAVLTVALVGLVAGGCGGGDATSMSATGEGIAVDLTTPQTAQHPTGVDDTAQAHGWPPAAPADIPPFPGIVDNLLTGRQGGSSDAEHSYGVRIFYTGVTRDAFDAYVSTLRSAGYAVKGIVYYSDATSEGEARSKKRAAAGDFDAVVATKAQRVLTVGVPAPEAGRITLDIDGLTEAENAALNVVAWPAAWAKRLPAPAGCHLTDRRILGVSETSLQLSCLYDDPEGNHQATVDAYKAVLAGQGYVVARTSSTDTVVLQSDTVEVTIVTDIAGRMQIGAHVRPDTTSAGGWPADWVTRVPPPQGCTYGADTLLSYGPKLLGIGCVYADEAAGDSVRAAYAAKLQGAGFTPYQPTEQRSPGTVSLRRDAIEVHLSPSGWPGGMMINATDRS